MEENKKTYYNKLPVEITHEFNTGASGLTDAQVEKNRETYGANRLAEAKRKSTLVVFLEQFKDLLVVILVIAAAISFATGSHSSTIVILVVLLLNAVLGTVQYIKAEKSLDSLKKLSSPEAKVIRDGKIKVIDAGDLVCGDFVLLDAGDIIPGDGRVVDCFSLKVNESSLTGESESVEKDSDIIKEENVALGDQFNMVFSGSLVTYGRARMIVTAVGEHTELGRIASLMNDTKERKTPLQVTMDEFSKKLSIGIMLIALVVFGLSMMRGMQITDALLFAVALAVAAIPEALSSIITISLAIGTSRMADENAIIKDLNAVEGLGCVSVICSDKTGTLTQNRMTVEYEYVRDGYSDHILLASILCNDGKIAGEGYAGDPTETAFIEHYINVRGRDEYDMKMGMYPRLSEVPFDSDRKLMSTLHKIDGEYTMYTKGALDVLIARSVNLTEDDIEEIRNQNEKLSRNGLRVLGFALRRFPEMRDLREEDEFELEYIGLIAEMDPPREESAQAVKDCLAAGIKPIMITGDHKVTASSIARRIGIMKDGDLAFTGPEVDRMSDEELMENLDKISVYARVSPDNKIRIVRAWQDKGCIVAMTGDGVNDGPALKSADVGVAMGITGTEVAKDSASMILTDDNFATIIKSVLNGRNIYNNIKNAIKFLLSGNAAAIIAVLYCSILGLPMPFTAVQLLFINLITDSLPALAISMEPLNHGLINDKPRPRTESVLNKPTLIEIAVQGILISIFTIIAFHVGLGSAGPIDDMISGVKFGSVTASTMAFAVLCLARLWHGFNCRGRENIFKLGLFTNVYSIGAFVLGAVLLHFILLAPFFHRAFGVAQVDPALIIWIWVLSFMPTLIIQLFKSIQK
ncbi:MAG: cation-translocating P-type ATPase [Eubacterium sp.]|nr:cation-translocating P-type ATPase [Eubacterium sp.]